MQYTREEIKKFVHSAVDLFIKRDSELLTIEAHEQAISHRIALYLEPYFPFLNIDCEYNRYYLEKTKKIRVEVEKCNKDQAEKCGCEPCLTIKDGDLLNENKIFRPDIAIHNRQTSNNIIVIELKTSKSCEFDKAKLRALTSNNITSEGYKYKYNLGLALYFIDKVAQYEWYESGGPLKD